MIIGSDEKSRDNPIRLSTTTSQKENIVNDRPENKMNPEKPMSARDFFEGKSSDTSLTSRDLNRLSNLSIAAQSRLIAESNLGSSCKPSSSAIIVEERKTVERNSNVARRFQNEDTVSPKPHSRLVKKKELDSEEDSAEETDSEDDSDDEDDSDEEEAEDTDEEERVKQKKKQVKQEVAPKSAGKPQVKKVVKSKDVLIYEVLKRWWYCVPEWPPAGYNYSQDLADKQLRKVDQRYWRIEPEIDATGCRKVYEVPSYPGVFRTSKGETIDLRPQDTCPSFANFKKKSILELCELLTKALRNQVEALQASPDCDHEYLVQLKKEFLIAQRTLDAQKLKK